MVIGLVVTLAITSVLIRGEGSKRSTTSVNDINQTGAYAAFVIDRAIRSAGSGFSQSWSQTYGCRLDVSQSGTAVLPLPTAIPAASPFENVTFPIRLAPVIIGKGLADKAGSVRGDVLMVMGGTAGFGEAPQPVKPVPPGTLTASNLSLQNALGFGTGDLILLADAGVSTSCMVQQVGTRDRSSSGSLVPLAGTYYRSDGTTVNLNTFGPNTIAMQLGHAVDNLPQFQLYGVGANNTLSAYDLLQPGGNETQIADSIVEMRALYGLDTTNPPDGVIDSWRDPIASSGYEASVLMDGTGTSLTKLRQIVAIRVGFILRTALAERPQEYQQPAGTTLTLFEDLGGTLTQKRVLGSSELNYRFRTVEVTIPLRNVLLAP